MEHDWQWMEPGMRSRSRHIFVCAGVGAAETVFSEPESEPEPSKTGRLRLRKATAQPRGVCDFSSVSH